MKENIQEVYAFLRQCNTYYLATIDNDQPRVRPFGTIDIFEDRLYIQTGKSKLVSHQIHINPKIEICGMAAGKWIRIEAEAYADERLEAKQHMLDAYPQLKMMYQADDGNTEVFALTKVTATIASFTEEPKIIKF
ncbi:hypothetical protein SDC9_85952 [bioreactor metagenome]|uniref:Pyridoxamine 5'-phosphate oxidase N-terminal domain-containing protein n=1 Tax=bioreactor metagenome TaxID=1076179 RepID=A0A644ZEX0_9ZZZZ